jgi:predicted alpha-1,2-mannosidase
LGYVPLRGKTDQSVSHALEYYLADWNIAQLATSLGKNEDARLFQQRSMGYRHYFSSEYGTLRPKLPDGSFYSPFDPTAGANFEPNPGFHEGTAWNYTFAVPHDVKGLIRLMGGEKRFVSSLQSVFDKKYFDVTNEPDIQYPYLFSLVKGEAWRTHTLVRDLLSTHFKNAPDGLPGNDDTGTLSAWAVFSMIGLYPECPGKPTYSMTIPTFDKITIQLDTHYYPSGTLVISKNRGAAAAALPEIRVDGKKHDGYSISHEALTTAKQIEWTTR